MKKPMILFLVGATLGPFFDGFHTHSHTTAYPHPWIFQMAWWVPLLFGAAAVGIGLSAPLAHRFSKSSPFLLSWVKVIVGITGFGLLYYASAFLSISTLQKVFLLGFGAFVLWIAFDRTWQGVLLAFGVALAGPLAEITLVHSKTFYYLKPDTLGIPYWLPFLYMAASVSIGNLGRKLK